MKKVSRRNFLKAVGITAAAAAVAGALTGCGSTSSGSTASGSTGASSAGASGAAADVVNIGSTGTLSSINPLLMDATIMMQYACMLQFCPLVALDENAEFSYVLADSIETEDNLTYTVHINDAAAWSDGTPVTADDVKFTITRLASNVIANPNMMLTALVGTDDNTGYLPEGVTELEGVQVVDEKTCTITFKYEMNRVSVLNGYAQYIHVLPAHVLADVPEADLAGYDWFKAPTVVDGPYICTDLDNDHYVSYKANEAYWKGAPQIPYLNIKVVESAQLLSGLQSGEIDYVPPLLGTFNLDDYNTVLALENVNADYGQAYSVESLFLNCKNIPLEIRQAMLCGLDRQTIIDGLLSGAGEQCDGFAVPEGPYWKGLEPTAFDAARATELVAQATANGWDPTTTYEMYLNSGEETLINAATIVQSFWQAVGIQVNVNPVDLGTLMTMAEGGEGDIYGVQYTYPPVDPSWDIQWVLGSWCFYDNDIIQSNLNTMWNTNDSEAYAEALYAIDQDVQANVPLIDVYVNGTLGAVAKRLSGAKVSTYGCLNAVETWTLNA